MTARKKSFVLGHELFIPPYEATKKNKKKLFGGTYAGFMFVRYVPSNS